MPRTPFRPGRGRAGVGFGFQFGFVRSFRRLKPARAPCSGSGSWISSSPPRSSARGGAGCGVTRYGGCGPRQGVGGGGEGVLLPLSVIRTTRRPRGHAGEGRGGALGGRGPSNGLPRRAPGRRLGQLGRGSPGRSPTRTSPRQSPVISEPCRSVAQPAAASPSAVRRRLGCEAVRGLARPRGCPVQRCQCSRAVWIIAGSERPNRGAPHSEQCEYERQSQCRSRNLSREYRSLEIYVPPLTMALEKLGSS